MIKFILRTMQAAVFLVAIAVPATLTADDCPAGYKCITIKADGNPTQDRTLVGRGDKILFRSVDGALFSAVFDDPSPFVGNHRVHVPAIYDKDQIDANAEFKEYKYQSCYYALKINPPCPDPKIIVKPTIFELVVNPGEGFTTQLIVDFGIQRVGTTTERSVVLANGRDESVEISVSQPLKPFQSIGCPGRLDPRATCTLTINFTPTQKSPQTSDLVLGYKDKKQKITVKGIGQ